ncbi:quinohemoprotein amine dehydrogenase subunit beta [Kaustia mangrovi]|uniref:Quinohemoprotein amine dehydrogenase subunit beta n=1 Tax=Kaustia mangrovi TaxID=2593653 RepID=A0A7S8C3V5_9HYPH|nr:quinohemoprotein amine dehydrogenase subunit beta [Kaustia mangrovi]QPC42872.1 quinohemoprotein amine dehydrogenase subunit beta [Kaustia mangrovi]
MNGARRIMKTSLVAAATALVALGAGAGTAHAKDYILTSVKPDTLVLVDAAARKVDKAYKVPDAEPGVLTITPSPDGKTAYVLINRWESISGIDLDSGKQVFRADFSSGEERVKGMFGMDISPDGSEIAVYQSPVALGLGEYEVKPTRIAFYDTSAGMDAKPVRTIPVPRQITLIMYSADGSKLYGLGRAVYVIDPKTGDILDEHKTQGWDRENFAPPDILDVWSQWEQAGVMVTPYYTARTDMDPMDPEAYVTGILSLDLKTGAFDLSDVENTDIFYFSSVASPTDPDIVFGAYSQLSKFDTSAGKALGRVDLDHSYYAINISSDGKEVYVGGTLGDISVHDAETLEKIGSIEMPDGASQGISSVRIIER